MVWAVRGALDQKTWAWTGCNWELLQEVCDGNDASGREFFVKRIKITVRGKVVDRKEDLRRVQVCVR